MSLAKEDRPTILVVGRGEPMEAGLRVALDRHGMTVEKILAAQLVEAVLTKAPDLVLLIGDAARKGGGGLLRHLAESPAASVVPVALLSNDASLGERLTAFRSGAVAVIPRSASVDAIATRVAELGKELPERSGRVSGELGESTLEELVNLVSKELRSGILSVEGEAKDGDPVRLVLGAGGPVAEALSAFVERLQPLIEKAEPLRYELLESSGGRLRLLEGEEEASTAADLSLLAELRILLMDNDPGRADVLAQAFRDHGALVAVTDVSVAGLERARGLDPEVVILDAAAIEGPGFEAVRSVRRDGRLRWASLLVARWDELWPDGSGTPDLAQLAGRIASLTEHDRALRDRAAKEETFDTRLELTGPSRLLRNLARVPGTRHATIRSTRATVEVDIADGLVVGARGTRHGDEPEDLVGTPALAALLALGSGRVHVETVGHPSVANVMSPVDEALDTAAREESPVPPSVPPADDAPFPPAAELGSPAKPQLRSASLERTDSGPILAPHLKASGFDAPAAPATRGDLEWGSADSELTVPALPAPPGPPAPSDASPTAPTIMGMSPAAKTKARHGGTMVGMGAFGGAEAKTPSPLNALRKKPGKGTMVGIGLPAGIGAQLNVGAPEATDQRGSQAPTPVPPPATPPEPEAPGPVSEPPDEDATLVGDSIAILREVEAAEERPTAPPPASGAVLDGLAAEDLFADPRSNPPADFEPRVDPHGPTAVGAPVVPLPDLSAPAVPSMEGIPIGPTPESGSFPPIPGVDEDTQTLMRDTPKGGGNLGKVMGALLAFLVVVLAGGAGLYFLAPGLLGLDPEVPGDPPGLDPLAAVLTSPDAAVAVAPTPDAAPAALVVPDAAPAVADAAPAVPDAAPAVPDATPAVPDAAPAVPDAAPAAPDAAPAAPDAESLPRDPEAASDSLVRAALRSIGSGDHAEAETQLTRAMELDPRNPQGMAAWARLHLARGDHGQALEWAQRAVRRRARRAKYHVLLGDVLLASGDSDGARRAWRAALERDSDNRHARRRLREN